MRTFPAACFTISRSYLVQISKYLAFPSRVRTYQANGTALMARHHPKHPSHASKHTQEPAHPPGAEAQLLASLRSDPSLIHLDGHTLEGGGQLVRVALTLSALTSIPIHIYGIRGNRSSHFSGKGAGLKSSHLSALKFLARATAAKTCGASVGSTEIVFEPRRDKQLIKDRVRSKDPTPKVGEAYDIRLDKPGSVWLILQAILPYVFFAASKYAPTQLVITGGTNVPKSMSGEYVKQVMCPVLEKIGLRRVDVDIKKRGWTNGRTIQIGEVGIKVHPLERGTKIPAFELKERGFISKIAISILAGTEAMRLALIEEATRLLLEKHPNLPPAQLVLNENSGDPKRLYVLLVAHTSNGYRLGRDWLFDEKIKGALNESQTELIAKKMGQRVVEELAADIAHGGCVDEYMRDQLVVFETLAAGTSYVDGGVGTGGGSLHAKTCRWVAEQILVDQVKFDERGGCMGVGFSAGEIYEERLGMKDVSLHKHEEQSRKESDGRGDGEISDQVMNGKLAEEFDDLELVER
jgi:RNA 3'-terminal phosphate cyclase (ATP)